MPSITSTVTPGARSMIWHLEAGGWTEREAGNLVALLHGPAAGLASHPTR